MTRVGLSRLLLAHGLLTLAAAVVLVVAPALIPRAVGVRLDAGGRLLAYLLGAAELGIAVLSLGARRLTDVAALRVVVRTCVVFHAASAALEGYAFLQGGAGGVVWANVVARAVVIALFAHFAPTARSA